MSHPAIIVHGGAGHIASDDHAEACARGCLAAARSGYAVLLAGGTSLDASQAAAVVLENDPNFNAGTGSVLNVDGGIEQDAMVMDGSTLQAGGVANLTYFKNAILVARAVLKSPHVLIGGAGADRFARECGFEPVPPAAMITERALTRWQREKDIGWPRKPGTIGAVAIDRYGHVASATSTGGISGKLVGRVGDTPMIGAGTYADDRGGAASCTGHGESIMRVVLGKLACDRMAAGASAQAAAGAAVSALDRVEGNGGLICISPAGELGWAFNTARMSRAWVDGNGREGSGFE